MLQVKLLHVDAILPAKKSEFAAGYDLFTPIRIEIDPYSHIRVGIGIATSFPCGWVGIIRERSSGGLKGLKVFGGVIDSDYRGEWGVILYNSTTAIHVFERGDRIAQVIFVPCALWGVGLFEGELDTTKRNTGGFGSTGA